MRNRNFRKMVVYLMIATMLLTSLLSGMLAFFM
ncbi:stressosome-associated protein Prli42 [Bacillus sp. CECT 9360]|nr:stressosome-associated protein Prli42 [Bacillus sp. CECT 9360]